MDTIVDYGTDINSNWSFKDGDLEITSNKDNLTQAIMNRLNTITDSLDLFYDDYGSYIRSFLGWKKTDDTLDFIKVELDNTIAKDSRVDNFSSEVSYDPNGNVRIDLQINYMDNSFEMNFVLDENGVEVM